MAVNTTQAEMIWTTLGAIPDGRVASFGQIAELAGLPGRARLVGRVLRELPERTALPWHRVLRADGRSAFAEGSDRCREQTARLQKEGVIMTRGRVNLRAFGWQPQTHGR